MLEQMIKLYSWQMGAANLVLVLVFVCCGPAPVLVGTILYNAHVIKGRILNTDNC